MEIGQGMNCSNRMARRYHWISDSIKSFVLEPHSGIISKRKSVLNMTSVNSTDNQRTCVDLAIGNSDNLKSSVYKVSSATLDRWFHSNSVTENDHSDNNNFIEHYQMPRKLDWNLFKRFIHKITSN